MKTRIAMRTKGLHLSPSQTITVERAINDVQDREYKARCSMTLQAADCCALHEFLVMYYAFILVGLVVHGEDIVTRFVTGKAQAVCS